MSGVASHTRLPFDGLLPHATCRVCGSTRLDFLFSLGEQYVSDFVNQLWFDDPRSRPSKKVPVTLDRCADCALVQQRYTAPSDFLYTRHYWYRSGVTETMRTALMDVVASAVEAVGGLRTGDVVLDIGSNDGTLLRHYDSYSPGGVIKVGVEPAENMKPYYESTHQGQLGIHLISDFWPTREYWQDVCRPAKVVTAIGMFYDLEDPNPFLKEVARVLAPEGVFVAQLMCLSDMLATNDVGNLCHEHLEFYSVKSLRTLFAAAGLEVFRVERNSVNGGSTRLYARHRGATVGEGISNAAEWSDHGYDSLPSIKGWYSRLVENRDRCRDFIAMERIKGKRVWVYGASTKGNVILQWYGLDHRTVEAAADRSPEKWGRYTVGTGIPVKSEDEFRAANPEYALVLPYAFLPEFVERERAWMESGGKFIVPLPKFRVVGKDGAK